MNCSCYTGIEEAGNVAFQVFERLAFANRRLIHLIGVGLNPMSSDSNPKSESSSSAKPVVSRLSKRRLWLFRALAATFIPLLFFVSIEIALGWIAIGYPTSFFVESEDHGDTLVDNYRFAWRFFPRSLARSPQPLHVTATKPSETMRIVVFGGSAAMGDPEPAFGFPRMLQALLELRYPDQQFEVINAAMTAINSHVVYPIARESRRLDADAWVVYMGNNEVHGPFGSGTVFGGEETPLWLIRAGLALNNTNTGQWFTDLRSSTSSTGPKSWGNMRMFLDHQIRHDDASLNRVYQNFEKNLVDILNTAGRADIPVVVSTIVTNLRDCPPFASLHSESLSAADQSQWTEHFEQGCRFQESGDYQQAIQAYQQAAAVDANYAELQFRLAQCSLLLNDPTIASEHFLKARDYDTLRFRATTEINETIREAATQAADQGIRFIDASRELNDQSQAGLAGSEFLCEHVHFTFEGNYQLAKLIADELVDVLQLPGGQDTWANEQTCANHLGFTPLQKLRFAQELRSRLRSPPFDQQLGHEQRDAAIDAEIEQLKRELTPEAARNAKTLYEQLLNQRPNDWILRKQYCLLLESLGDIPGAIEQWKLVAAHLSHHPDAFFILGTLYNRQKDWPQAVEALQTAVALRPRYPRAFNSLGISLSHLGNFQESYDSFAQAIALQPTYAEAYLNWGDVLLNQKETDAAIQKYEAAIEANPDFLRAHLKLGKHFVDQQQFVAAEPHYEAVVRIKPDDAAAHLNLGFLYLKTEQRTQAIEQLEKVMELDPNNALARQALAALRH